MILRNWIITGIITYTIIAILRWKNFKNADIGGVLRGLFFGICLWPVAIIYLALEKKNDEE